MAYWLKTDGTIEEVKPANGKTFELKELQMMVGGFIEQTYTIEGDCLIVNEEGKLHGLPLNPIATDRYKYRGHDVIVGNAVQAKLEELQGDEDEE